MGSGGGSTWFPKIATILLAIAFLLHLTAIGSAWWARADPSRSDRVEHIGLWRYCTDSIGGGEVCYDFVEIIYGDWLKVAQSFMSLSLLTMSAAVGIAATYVFVAKFKGNIKVLLAAMSVVAITGIFTLTCIAVFSDRFQQYFNTRNPDNWGGQDIGVLDWSFGLAATDCILTFIALALLAVGLATVADKPYYIKV